MFRRKQSSIRRSLLPEVSFRWQEPESCLLLRKYESVAWEQCSAWRQEFAVNILVNYYLMFRLNMGIKGAAFGTVTAQAVVVMAGCAILWKTGYRKWRPLWHGQYAADIFKIGITAFGTSLAPTAALIFDKSAVSSLWWKCSGGVLCGYFLYCISCSVFSDRNRRRCTASD